MVAVAGAVLLLLLEVHIYYHYHSQVELLSYMYDNIDYHSQNIWKETNKLPNKVYMLPLGIHLNTNKALCDHSLFFASSGLL